jgi:Phosphotransferase enzyme family
MRAMTTQPLFVATPRPTLATSTDRFPSWLTSPMNSPKPLAQHERDRPIQPRRQLAHGDFWDNNVRLRHGQVALVTDFDFLADHPRTDDLALTLYLTSVDITDITSDPAPLTELADAYESGLGTRLSQRERPPYRSRGHVSVALSIAALATRGPTTPGGPTGRGGGVRRVRTSPTAQGYPVCLRAVSPERHLLVAAK